MSPPDDSALDALATLERRTTTLDFDVTDADTARALGSGDVDVLATPRLIAWLEAATCAVVAEALPAGTTSVGVRVDVEHLVPSYVGSHLRAEALLAAVVDRRLHFEVALYDGERVTARGVVVRAVVDRSRFAGR